MGEQTDNRQIFPTLTWPQAGLVVFLGMAGFFLWGEHKAHILGALPYLIILLCPFMHVFMHRGHSGNNSNDKHH